MLIELPWFQYLEDRKWLPLLHLNLITIALSGAQYIHMQYVHLCEEGQVWICTEFIKSNRSLYVSVSQEKDNKFSDLKFLTYISRVIDVSITEFQVKCSDSGHVN